MDYKAAWEDLRREVDSVVAIYQEFEDRDKLTERGDALRQGYKSVAIYMKQAEELAAAKAKA